MSNTAYASTSTAGTVVVGGAAIVLGGGGAVVDGAPVVVGAAVVGGAGLVMGARVAVDAGEGGVVGATSTTDVAPGKPPSVAVVPAPRSELHAPATSTPAQSAVVSRRGDIAPKVPAL
jgi:hypothetical protein